MERPAPNDPTRVEQESGSSEKTSPEAGRPFTDPISRHQFRNASLYQRALTHTSAALEALRVRRKAAAPEADVTPIVVRPQSNQQLEFLGDAVLGLVAARELYFAFPDADEGTLSRMRASIVSRDNLAAVATRLRLPKYLRVGRGEEQSGGRQKPALLADGLEALIAAIYLDSDLAAAAIFIAREIVRPSLATLETAFQNQESFGDHKTALQVRLRNAGKAPNYTLLHSVGPAHERTFRVRAESKGSDGSMESLAEAEGSSKKRAEQEAARLALLALDAQTDRAAESSPA